jgi:transposase-like protein
METIPTTLRDAIIHYADLDACEKQMIASRWPNGVFCPKCGLFDPTYLKTVHRFKCNNCKFQFSTKLGTIFEDSPIPLTKWLPAVWMLTCAKNGISSYELSRGIGVTQKTGWFMLHRIREAISTGSLELFRGTTEADETWIGGLDRNKHEDKKPHAGPTGAKSIVFGVLERGTGVKKSKVKATIIYNRTHQTLHGKIRESIQETATIYTDAWKGYRGLSARYLHDFVDHAINYALGQVHTNGLENFWSLLKRCLKGTYIAVQPFHLRRYIDEMVFRFNNRDGNDRERFDTALKMIIGKRLTFDTLTRSYEAYYHQIGLLPV